MWCMVVRSNVQNDWCLCNIWIEMPSISTCMISQLTALERDCLICVNSIPQPCRTLQRSKCQDGGRRKITERSYVGGNGGERQTEFTNTQKSWYQYFSAAERGYTYAEVSFDWSGWERQFVAGALVSAWPQICESVFLSQRQMLLVWIRKPIPLCFCAWWADTFTVCACFFPLFLDLPLGAHVLLLNRHTRHLAQPDTHLDISKLQPQVLPKNGHPGSPLARTCLREQLDIQWMEVRLDRGRRHGEGMGV